MLPDADSRDRYVFARFFFFYELKSAKAAVHL